MYSQSHDSEVSQPPSLSRPRPWSPDPTDPLPSLRPLGDRLLPIQTSDTNRISPTHQYRTHEPSDPSIDALDLADYARILNPHPYPSGPIYDDYPLPAPARSFTLTSHASLNPPSLVSSRGTPTSQSHSASSRHIDDREFPPSIPVSSRIAPSVYVPTDGALYSPKILHPPFDTPSSHGGIANSEIDITQFPAWSRGWYAKNSSSSLKTGPRSETSHAHFFDPSYRATRVIGNQYDPYAAANSTSSRDFVPWSEADAPKYDLPLDPELKEERIRMLEDEFGSKLADPAKEEPVGSVDEKGRLITDGPKKRVAIRTIETLLALGIAVSLVYAALVRYHVLLPVSADARIQWIKPLQTPPPQSKPQTLALYALSVLTSIFFLYHFLFRPCCCAGRRKKRTLTGYPGGLAVLPVQGLLGDKKKKKGKKGKQEQGGVQVNLIVDPTVFRRHDDEESANHDEYSSSFSQAGTGQRPKRRSVFEGLAMEEKWKVARKELKWMLFVDIVCLFLWSVEFIWILIRERCPPGGFNGWCVRCMIA